MDSIRNRFSAHFFTLIVSTVIGMYSASATSVSVVDFKSQSEAQKPLSLSQTSLAAAPSISLPKLNTTELSQQDLLSQNTQTPYRFAIPYTAKQRYTEDGEWTFIGDSAIWRLSVTAKHGQSLNFGFDNVFLPQGSKLFVYSADQQKIIGPFTDRDNKPHRQLWTPVIEAQQVTIEINLPIAQKPFLSFELISINQGYRSFLADPRTGAESTNMMGCHNDVVCAVGDPWRDEIRSVARYTISGGGMCTGQLVNNVNEDQKPYFLTAEHCGPTVSTSPSMVFYWNYEASICDGALDGQLNQFTTGATFRSNYARPQGSDFALVEIDSIPQQSYNVYWAGWDNTAPAPSSGVVIHHSRGEEKRISFDNDPLLITASGGNSEDPSGTHLRVGNWESGLIEGGASGSGIWNAAHRLVGTYSGGTANCSATNGSSWFGRMATHWAGDGNSNGQLKVWLDPANTGTTTLDGLNNASCVAISSSIDISVNPAVLVQNIQFNASASGGTGTLNYAWDLDADGQTDSTSMTTNKSYPYLFQDNVRLTVTDAAGCNQTTSAALVVTTDGNEIFLADGSVPQDWSQSSGADASWVVDASQAFEGNFSLKSASITHNQTAAIEVTQNFDQASDNFVGFVVNTSSENNSDLLNFYIDDVLQQSWSGETTWRTVHYPLTQGNHTLKWSYQKDANTNSGSDSVWIDGVTGINFSTVNLPPVAAVTQSQITASGGNNVNLNASPSSDPEGQTLAFSWTQISGTNVTLSSPTSAQATFIAPDVTVNTVLVFRVSVSDPAGNTDTADVTVTISATPNLPPIASLVASVINVTGGNSVNLDATTSSDPEGQPLSFSWSQLTGTNVSLTGTNNSLATFSAPNISQTLTFRVSVSDPAGNTDTADVTVNITQTANQSPNAVVASSSFSAIEGTTVSLNGQASSDPDSNDTLTFQWTQVSGPTVSLNNATSAIATFTAPQVSAATTLEFMLTVTDNQSASDSTNVVISVTDQAPAPTKESGGGGASSIFLILFAIARITRRRK